MSDFECVPVSGVLIGDRERFELRAALDALLRRRCIDLVGRADPAGKTTEGLVRAYREAALLSRQEFLACNDLLSLERVGVITYDRVREVMRMIEIASPVGSQREEVPSLKIVIEHTRTARMITPGVGIVRVIKKTKKLLRRLLPEKPLDVSNVTQSDWACAQEPVYDFDTAAELLRMGYPEPAAVVARMRLEFFIRSLILRHRNQGLAVPIFNSLAKQMTAGQSLGLLPVVRRKQMKRCVTLANNAAHGGGVTAQQAADVIEVFRQG